MTIFLDWPIQRLLLLFSSFSLIMVTAQVSLFHYRGNFRHMTMWAPVLVPPLLALIGLILIYYDVIFWRWAFVVVGVSVILASLIGFILHIRGVMLRVGGWKLRNVLTGPPVLLPLTLGFLSLLGIIALYW